MKYIKYFEDNKREFGRFYWSVHNEPRKFKKELEKINCPDKTINYYINQKISLFEEDILFVGVVSDFYGNQWYISNRGSNFTGLNPFEYKGPILLSRKELDEIEMEDKVEKYNL